MGFRSIGHVLIGSEQGSEDDPLTAITTIASS